MKFAWIKAHQAEFPVQPMCAALQVSRSGFYTWLERPLSARAQRQEVLVAKIRTVHQHSRQIYGSPRVHQELLAQGDTVCENTVAKLMQRHQIRSKIKRRFVPWTTNSCHSYPVAENILAGQFETAGPNQKWVADITYVRTGEGWLYLAGVLDLYSRKIVGWSMSARLETTLVSEALKMALHGRQPGPGVLHHSDRGVQYASASYQGLLAKMGLYCSMSRSGNCYDNAVMESFWGTLKRELVYHSEYRTREEARQAIFEYIEVFYNRQRRHSALGYLSPEAFEAARN